MPANSCKFIATAAAVGVLSFAASQASAQFVTYYSPVVAAPAPVVSYSAVAPVVYPQPVVTTVARPVVTTVASPVVTVASPVATATFVAPTAVVRTRYRPFRGRVVSRVRYRYAPVTVFGY